MTLNKIDLFYMHKEYHFLAAKFDEMNIEDSFGDEPNVKRVREDNRCPSPPDEVRSNDQVFTVGFSKPSNLTKAIIKNDRKEQYLDATKDLEEGALFGSKTVLYINFKKGIMWRDENGSYLMNRLVMHDDKQVNLILERIRESQFDKTIITAIEKNDDFANVAIALRGSKIKSEELICITLEVHNNYNDFALALYVTRLIIHFTGRGIRLSKPAKYNVNVIDIVANIQLDYLQITPFMERVSFLDFVQAWWEGKHRIRHIVCRPDFIWIYKYQKRGRSNIIDIGRTLIEVLKYVPATNKVLTWVDDYQVFEDFTSWFSDFPTVCLQHVELDSLPAGEYNISRIEGTSYFLRGDGLAVRFIYRPSKILPETLHVLNLSFGQLNGQEFKSILPVEPNISPFGDF